MPRWVVQIPTTHRDSAHLAVTDALLVEERLVNVYLLMGTFDRMAHHGRNAKSSCP